MKEEQEYLESRTQIFMFANSQMRRNMEMSAMCFLVYVFDETKDILLHGKAINSPEEENCFPAVTSFQLVDQNPSRPLSIVLKFHKAYAWDSNKYEGLDSTKVDCLPLK